MLRMKSNAAPLTVEEIDNFSHTLRELSEYDEYWVIDEPKGGLIERYLNGSVCIAFRRSEGVPWGQPNQDGLILHAAPIGAHTGSPHCHGETGNDGLHVDQPFMLSPNIELMEGKQKWVSSVVRLKFFDRGDLGQRKPLFAFDSNQRVNKIMKGIENGKMHFSIRYYAVSSCESGGENIQTAAHGINDRARLSIDSEIEGDPFIGHNQLLASIRVCLSDNFVWVGLAPGNESLLQEWNLGIGPIDGGIGV